MIVIFFSPKKASSPVQKPSRQMKENSLSVFVCKNPFEGLQSTHNGPFCTLKVQLEVKISQDCGLVVIVRYHYRFPPYSQKSYIVGINWRYFKYLCTMLCIKRGIKNII